VVGIYCLHQEVFIICNQIVYNAMIFGKKRFMKWGLMLLAPLAFLGCKDDAAVDGTGQLRIEMTDAPVDDAQISGVFVTISKVYVDGKLWEGLNGKQTVELTALQNGSVNSLGIAEVDAKSNSKISIVFDLDQDADGNSPGCYVRKKDNSKHDLAASTASEMTIDVSGSDYDIMKDGSTTVVVDFDLRKALRYGNSNEPGSSYSFGTAAQMNAALRVVAKAQAGSIQGHCMDVLSGSEKIVVYAYAKGSFNRTQEMSGASDEQFTHAVTSASVDAQGDYKLSYLEPGEYEVVFASYKDDGSNGTLDLQGTLMLEALLGLDPKAISVGTSSTVTLNISVIGLLP
jgi:hypothetical protein